MIILALWERRLGHYLLKENNRNKGFGSIAAKFCKGGGRKTSRTSEALGHMSESMTMMVERRTMGREDRSASIRSYVSALAPNAILS